MFNIQEKIQCIKWFYAGNSQVEVRDLFSAVYHDRPIPTITTINRIIKQFNSTGSVFKPCKKCSMTVEENNEVEENMHENKLNVLLAVTENPNISIRQIAAEMGHSSFYSTKNFSYGHILKRKFIKNIILI